MGIVINCVPTQMEATCVHAALAICLALATLLALVGLNSSFVC